MSARDPIGGETALASLRSRLCPACGGFKGANRPLCRPCRGRLTIFCRDALWAPEREGYAEGLAAALEELRVDAPHWPEVES